MIGLPMPIRAVLFDAGETLLSPHPSFPELLSQTLNAEGFTHVTPDLIRDQVKVVASSNRCATTLARSRMSSGETCS